MTYLIVLGIGVALLFVVRTTRRKPVLTATIDMQPSGVASVRFEPAEVGPDLLMLLLLCYGAKLRWILNQEPPAIAEALREWSAEALDQWAALGVSDLIGAIPTASEFVRGTSGHPATVSSGERFVIRLFVHKDGFGYITNDIPRPGMAVNLAWNYVFLLDAVRSRLDQKQRSDSALALQAWWDAIFSDLGADKSMRGAHALNRAANEAFERAKRVTR